jgi:AsmA family protein
MLGLPFPALPDFRGTTKLTGGNRDWQLDALTLKTGASDLAGGLKIDTNAKVPQVTAKLTAHLIDLADFKGVVGAKPAHSSTEKPQPEDKDHLIPDTPMAVQKLPGLNADLTFDAARIKQVSGIPFERVSLGSPAHGRGADREAAALPHHWKTKSQPTTL